jgi:hypothetical protein
MDCRRTDAFEVVEARRRALDEGAELAMQVSIWGCGSVELRGSSENRGGIAMLRCSSHLRSLVAGVFAMGLALGAQAAPEMFEASFIFHAWGNDISSGATSPYTENWFTAVPLGYDCQHAEPYTFNGAPSSRYCSPAIMHKGHPATGRWTRSIGTGSPPRITLQQSDLAIQLNTHAPTSTYETMTPPAAPTKTHTISSSYRRTPHCCRGFSATFPPYLQSFTYATFVNAAGSFFAGGGPAAALGYNNKTGMNTGTWRIQAGKNAFGGAMGLLGKYGGTGKYSITGKTGTYVGISSWAMVPDVGRPLFNTIIGSGTMGTPLYQNPFSKTDMWYKTTPKGKVKVSTLRAIGSGTLWTTGQVGGFAKTGAYYSSAWRTGYDNRTPGGLGNIQLVTPTLTHWLSPGFNSHTQSIGMLKIRVPEPGAMLLLAAGAGVLALLHRMARKI